MLTVEGQAVNAIIPHPAYAPLFVLDRRERFGQKGPEYPIVVNWLPGQVSKDLNYKTGCQHWFCRMAHCATWRWHDDQYQRRRQRMSSGTFQYHTRHRPQNSRDPLDTLCDRAPQSIQVR